MKHGTAKLNRLNLQAPRLHELLPWSWEKPDTQAVTTKKSIGVLDRKAEMVRNGKAVNDSKLVLLEAGKDVTVEFKEPGVTTAEK